MIEIIEDLPDNVAGVTLSANVSAEDYETVFMPMIADKFAKYEKVRVLYHVDDGFESYDFRAMIDDAKVGFEYWSSYEKIALVSDVNWLMNSAKAFSFFLPGEIAFFSNAELEKAKVWLDKPPRKHLSLDINLDPKSAIVTLHPKDRLSKEDFIRASGLIDPFIQEVGKLNGLIIETKLFPGWDSFVALFSHLKFVKEHHKQVKKIAFVTNSILGEGAEKIGSHFIAAEVKRFTFTELEEAKEWILEEL